MPLFGSSGIRQIADEHLLKLSLKVGLSLGSEYESVIVGRDTRTSGQSLDKSFTAGLTFSGATVFEAGILPTPTLAYAARKFSLGAMITASHNPPEYNGIKLFNIDGSAFDVIQRDKLEKKLRKARLSAVSWDKMGTTKYYAGAIEEHISAVLSNTTVSRKLKVVIDCGCGAASAVTPELLRRLGCEVVALNSYESGFFPRPVEPLPENLTDLSRSVKAIGADLGLAHDGDADRVVAVDENGSCIAGDKLLIILARQVEAKKIIVNIDSSMVVDKCGFEVVRTRVGDTYISEELKNGGDFGGEPSGAFIFPKLTYCPDGIYAAALIAQAASARPLSELAENIPEFPILRGAVPGNIDLMVGIEEKLNAYKPLSTEKIDGIRFNFNDGWLLLRQSGTEPKIRITAEASTTQRADEIYQAGYRAIMSGLIT